MDQHPAIHTRSSRPMIHGPSTPMPFPSTHAHAIIPPMPQRGASLGGYTMHIRLKGHSFALSEPYSEGHPLSQAEAQALNSLRAENIRNNMAKPMEQALAQHGNPLPPGAQAEMQATVTSYEVGYQFPLRDETRRRVRPLLEKSLDEVACEYIRQELRAQGLTASEPEIEVLALRAKALPSIQAEARRRASAAQEAAMRALEELL